MAEVLSFALEDPGRAAEVEAVKRAFANGTAVKKPDKRHVLSMHQPWASLFASGIKRVEGRSWRSEGFTSGWLWIHAAAAVPDKETIVAVEASYSAQEARDFPPSYPQSCILGRVYVVGQLSRDEYRDMGYGEDNDSEFVFLSAPNSWELLALPLAMKGDHKMWKLSKSVHATVRKAIEANK